MTLVEAIKNAVDGTDLVVYSMYPFCESGLAKICAFPELTEEDITNGFEYFASSSECYRYLLSYVDDNDDGEFVDYIIELAAKSMIEEWNTDIDGSIIE